jgi:hypothetical protein
MQRRGALKGDGKGPTNACLSPTEEAKLLVEVRSRGQIDHESLAEIMDFEPPVLAERILPLLRDGRLKRWQGPDGAFWLELPSTNDEASLTAPVPAADLKIPVFSARRTAEAHAGHDGAPPAESRVDARADQARIERAREVAQWLQGQGAAPSLSVATFDDGRLLMLVDGQAVLLSAEQRGRLSTLLSASPPAGGGA